MKNEGRGKFLYDVVLRVIVQRFARQIPWISADFQFWGKFLYKITQCCLFVTSYKKLPLWRHRDSWRQIGANLCILTLNNIKLLPVLFIFLSRIMKSEVRVVQQKTPDFHQKSHTFHHWWQAITAQSISFYCPNSQSIGMTDKDGLRRIRLVRETIHLEGLELLRCFSKR